MDNYQPIGLGEFFGGWATDKQLGSGAQFYYSQHFDFRKNPSSLTLLPRTANADGGVVVDLVQAMDQINSGVRYALGDAGWLYKITTAGVWSAVANLGEAGGAGLLYRSDVDHLYATGQTKVSRISRVSTTAAVQPNWFANGVSTCITCSKSGGTNTYTLPTLVDEGNTVNRRSFTSDIEPLYKIGVKVVAKGTGDWTLTLHDDANNLLGTATILTANISIGVINYFVFSSPIRIQRGDNGGGSALTYHYHLTSTVADGTVATTTASSLADCDMELWANALVPTNNGLHPIMQFSNFTLIGNGRYVAAYEPLQDNPNTADFLRHRLTLPPGFEVCGFAQKNLMCVIGAEKRSTSGEFQEGMLFFWDVVADTYNDYWPVPEGSPESLFSHKNVVHFIAGGALYQVRGGDEPVKKHTFRNTDSEYSGIADTTHLYPNMMTVRRGVLLMGYPSVTTNQALEHGIYSRGTVTSQYPDSFGFNYTTSNVNILNNGSNNLRIGMVKSYGDTLYISWRDDSASPHRYSVDIVNNSSPPAATGTIETLQFDDHRRYGFKKAGYVIITFETLPPNCSVTPKWKLDGNASWTYGEAVTSGTYAVSNVITPNQYQYAEFGFDVTCAGTVSPEITGVYLFTDTQNSAATQQRPIGVS
jgi:hypothetical protein